MSDGIAYFAFTAVAFDIYPFGIVGALGGEVALVRADVAGCEWGRVGGIGGFAAVFERVSIGAAPIGQSLSSYEVCCQLQYLCWSNHSRPMMLHSIDT